MHKYMLMLFTVHLVLYVSLNVMSLVVYLNGTKIIDCHRIVCGCACWCVSETEREVWSSAVGYSVKVVKMELWKLHNSFWQICNFHKMLTENVIVSVFVMAELCNGICVLILAALVNKTILPRTHTCTHRIPLWNLAVFLFGAGCSSGPWVVWAVELRSSSYIVQLRWGGSWGAFRPDGISNPSSVLWVWHSVPQHSAQTSLSKSKQNHIRTLEALVHLQAKFAVVWTVQYSNLIMYWIRMKSERPINSGE